MSEMIPVRQVEVVQPSRPAAASKSLYASSAPIHTRSFTGRFRNFRLLGAGLLCLLFFGTLWFDWDGRQAVLWSLEDSKFYIFGATFWPQDFILLSGLLIICAFGLFFITVFAGRVWCGYSCPQSVWTWMFMWVEQRTQGDRNQRIKLAAAPWGVEKVARNVAKHGLWLAISLATAVTFVGYFTPVRELATELVTFQAGGISLFWVLFFTAATYVNAGWMREQVCIHMCPYARFQSVMFDKDTLIVSYDAARGESRGARKKGSDPKAQGLGDCIDCTVCVQVCPTGIDIRDGLQIACIGCAACVDACDSVMDKMGYARGLVGYSSERALEGGHTHLLRPRLIGYATALVLMIGAFGWLLASRSEISLDVIKDRGMFRENAAGEIENIYNLKLINKTQVGHRYRLELAEGEGLRLQAPAEVSIEAGEILELPVSVAQEDDTLGGGSRELVFRITSLEGDTATATADSTFVSPRR
ncbi:MULTISPECIES: cytochrome c oxidase accessory protein CcoG [unclassified Pseudomonas]|jgi:cytochrome c oxidase accessory protein FixG|uniref:cytochrome c oxidase accessory protein CcoG n=1 Tax=unclassified Pseudomonas TaxID=196821 RepID=UPI000DA91CDB|nr:MULTISPECIES: cytochrome c oxidase accessory protein CcoG [unclassified Pseudomonas]MDW3711659.1 cytochrome c oxidase accessory protein CcoG [Pseudomonas sp. 2023EL-01195]PZE10889.1 cytochrome c oxidase accessory protein CcoG [Pseudomonas sp. 57B-090624]